MPCLLNLPAELRQKILLLALPDEDRVGAQWPCSASILTLLHICRCLREDMGEVIGVWEPKSTVVPYPYLITRVGKQTAEIAGKESGPKDNRVCLQIFQDADPDRIKWTCYCVHREKYTHPELIEAWLGVVPQLPSHISSILLDVTPAPGWMRRKADYVSEALIHDKRAAKKFLGFHIDDIFRIIVNINRHFRGNIQIQLSGTLSMKSQGFVAEVVARTAAAGIDVSYSGNWVTEQKADGLKMQKAINNIAPKQAMRQARKNQEPFQLDFLRRTRWSKDSKVLMAQVEAEWGEDVSTGHLRKVAEFVVNPSARVLTMEPTGNIRRALTHNLAKDMGLETRSENHGENRFVVVSK
jgi:hypothetical protein